MGESGNFEIAVSSDKMKAVIKRITPPRGDGASVGVENIENKLSEMNIVFGIDNDAILNCIKNVEKGQPVFNVTIAIGEKARAGRDRVIDLKFGDFAANKDSEAAVIVKKGQVVAVKGSLDTGSSGHDVFGKEITTRSGKDLTPAAGLNILVSKDGLTYTSAIYGRVVLEDNKISVFNTLEIAEDRMSARMDVYPILADNSRLEIDDVLKILKMAGVVYGIREQSVAKAVAQSIPTPKLEVAVGTPASHGVDAKLSFNFSLNKQNPQRVDRARREGIIEDSNIVKHLVFGGDLLLRKTPLEKAVNGHTVTGDLIAGTLPLDIDVSCGKHVVLLEDGVTYAVEKEYYSGYPDYKAGVIFVEDPLRLSEDKMKLFMTIYPPVKEGRYLTKELIIPLVNHLSIVRGCSVTAIKMAMAKVEESQKPLRDVLIAKGTLPVNGADAKIEFIERLDRAAGVSTGEADKIDFRERGLIHVAKEGAVIAKKTPAEPGIKGFDLLGNPLNPEPGEDKVLHAMDNVRLSKDGLTYSAEIDGVISFYEGDKIAVIQHYEVTGDVDYSSGNLSMDGSLTIKGWVRTGFTVKATGDILINGGVEGSFVKSKHNITVKEGVIGAGNGKVKAGGSLYARFAEEAFLFSGGDLEIKDAILRSRVICGGSLKAVSGKGNIRGGRTSALKGIHVNTLGSVAGARTLVLAGVDLACQQRLVQLTHKVKEYRRSRSKIEKMIARIMGTGKRKKITKDISRKMMLLAKKRRDMVMLEAKNARGRRAAFKRLSSVELKKVKISVNKAVYSGTTVAIGKKLYNVREDILSPVIFIVNTRGQVVYVKK